MPDRRRRHLVQTFQYKLVVRLVTYWFLYQITLWNFMFCWRLLEHGDVGFFAAYRDFCVEFYPMILCFLVLVPAFAWDAIRFYHGIAGPLVQFRRVIKDITAGRPARRVKLRKNDELLELQDDFNEMLDMLVSRNVAQLVQPDSINSSPPDDRGNNGSVSGNGDSSAEKLFHAPLAR